MSRIPKKTNSSSRASMDDSAINNNKNKKMTNIQDPSVLPTGQVTETEAKNKMEQEKPLGLQPEVPSSSSSSIPNSANTVPSSQVKQEQSSAFNTTSIPPIFGGTQPTFSLESGTQPIIQMRDPQLPPVDLSAEEVNKMLLDQLDNPQKDSSEASTPTHQRDGFTIGTAKTMSEFSFTGNTFSSQAKMGTNISASTSSASFDICNKIKQMITTKKQTLERFILRQMELGLIATPTVEERAEMQSLMTLMKQCREDILNDESNLTILKVKKDKSIESLKSLKGQVLNDLLNVIKENHSLPDYRKTHAKDLFSIDQWMSNLSETIHKYYRLHLRWDDNTWESHKEAELLRFADAVIEKSDAKEVYSHGTHLAARKQGWKSWVILLRSCFAQPILEYKQYTHLLFQHRMMPNESLMSWTSRIDDTLKHFAFASDSEREVVRWNTLLYGMNDDLILWLIPTYLSRSEHKEVIHGGYGLTSVGITEANKRCNAEFTYPKDKCNSSALYFCMLSQIQDKIISRSLVIHDTQMVTSPLMEVHFNQPIQMDNSTERIQKKRNVHTYASQVGAQTPFVRAMVTSSTQSSSSSTSPSLGMVHPSRVKQIVSSSSGITSLQGGPQWNLVDTLDLVVEVDAKGVDLTPLQFFTIPRPFRVQMYDTMNTTTGQINNPQLYKITLSQNQCDVFKQYTGIDYIPPWCQQCCKAGGDKKKYNCHPTFLCNRYFRAASSEEKRNTATQNPPQLLRLPKLKN